MRTSPFRRAAAVLLLTLVAILAAPVVSAAGSRNEISGPAEALSLSPLELLEHLWSFLRAAWSKDSCSIDPSGLCNPGTNSPPPAQIKDGCGIDPSGLCNPGTASPPPAQTKYSCGIDPNGHCKP